MYVGLRGRTSVFSEGEGIGMVGELTSWSFDAHEDLIHSHARWALCSTAVDTSISLRSEEYDDISITHPQLSTHHSHVEKVRGTGG